MAYRVYQHCAKNGKICHFRLWKTTETAFFQQLRPVSGLCWELAVISS